MLADMLDSEASEIFGIVDPDTLDHQGDPVWEALIHVSIGIDDYDMGILGGCAEDWQGEATDDGSPLPDKDWLLNQLWRHYRRGVAEGEGDG